VRYKPLIGNLELCLEQRLEVFQGDRGVSCGVIPDLPEGVAKHLVVNLAWDVVFVADNVPVAG